MRPIWILLAGLNVACSPSLDAKQRSEAERKLDAYDDKLDRLESRFRKDLKVFRRNLPEAVGRAPCVQARQLDAYVGTKTMKITDTESPLAFVLARSTVRRLRRDLDRPFPTVDQYLKNVDSVRYKIPKFTVVISPTSASAPRIGHEVKSEYDRARKRTTTTVEVVHGSGAGRAYLYDHGRQTFVCMGDYQATGQTNPYQRHRSKGEMRWRLKENAKYFIGQSIKKNLRALPPMTRGRQGGSGSQ